MNRITEELAETERWIGPDRDEGQHGVQPGSHSASTAISTNTVSADTISRENPWSLSENLPRTRRAALLTSVVEAEILPRLARLRRNAGVTGESHSTITKEDESNELVRLLLSREASDATEFVDNLRLRGVTPASLFLGVVTRAAQILGEMWEQDRCDFAQVSISMGRLQQVLRGLSRHFQLEAITRAQPETVLLAPSPGEQHTFGLLMVGEFFRREGWRVAGGPATSANEAVSIVRRDWVDVAGFSIGSPSRLDGLAHCIRAVRRASRNPNLHVMVGGPLILTKPGLAARTGADVVATDAAAAVRQANGLLGIGAAAD